MTENKTTFPKSIQTNGSLHRMLNQENITPQILFAVPNITGDIKQNIQAFLNFCLKNKQFCNRLLTITFDSSYQDLQNQQAKKVAQYSIDILTNDQDALVNFLFNKKPQPNNSEEISQNIQTDITSTIESQAQRLFNDSPTKKQQALWQLKQNAYQQFELIPLTLSHLHKKQKNQTCLGYINKLYSSLLRRQGNLFLQFLKQKPQFIQLLINNINHLSIANMIALLVSCQDKTGQYKHQNIKKQIFQQILSYGFNNIQNPQNFYGFLSSIQQIINSTKQSYYQHFDDFKRCANILVSQQTLQKFYQSLKNSQKSFNNASSYLQLILKRINNQQQQQQHDYYQQTDNHQPTMNFQHHFLFQQINHLISYINTSSQYPSLTRIIFIEFLTHLFKNKKQKNSNITNPSIFQQLLVKPIIYQKHLILQQNHGIIKNYLYQIIKILFQNMTKTDLELSQQFILNHNPHQQTNFSSLYETTPNVNQNIHTHSCFIIEILFLFHKNNPNFLTKYQQKYSINLIETFNKFNIKLANYGQQPQSPNCQQIQLNLKFNKNNNNLFLNKKQQQTQTIGKNNVVIPVLNLPNKIQFTKITIEQEQVEKVKIPTELTRQDIIKDLKNTRIELPNKFKTKKISQNTQNNTQDQKQIKKTFKLEIPDQQETFETTQNISEHPKIPKIPQSPVFVQIQVDPNEKKYFIKHILLF